MHGQTAALIIYGALPGPIQTSPGAELRAAAPAMQHAAVPVEIAPVRVELVDGVARGKARCFLPRRANHDARARIWRLIEDLGGAAADLVSFAHSEGHFTDAANLHRNGNKWAGTAARLGQEIYSLKHAVHGTR